MPARLEDYRKPKLAGHEALLRELVEAQSSIILARIKSELTTHGIEAGCLWTIWHILCRVGPTHRKTV
ncbi:MAG: hypothetical protein INR71_02950 [Terriglobus roseus]|nr:hypothetical protein [Terriglobus roseus]